MKYLYILLIGLCACSSTQFQEEQDTVNSLILEYDSLLGAIQSIDIQSAGPNLRKYKESLDYSKTKLSTKQMPSLETMKYLNDMKLMKRQFKSAPIKKEKLVAEVIRNQEQLQNLINDISNAIFEEEDLNLIIIREQQALESVTLEKNKFSEAYKSFEIRFDSLHKLTKTFNYE